MCVIISCYRLPLVNYPKGNNSSGWEELTQTLHTRAFHTSAVTVDGEILLVGPTLLHSLTLIIDAQWCTKMIKWCRRSSKVMREKKVIFINRFGQHLLHTFVNQSHLRILTSFSLIGGVWSSRTTELISAGEKPRHVTILKYLCQYRKEQYF